MGLSRGAKDKRSWRRLRSGRRVREGSGDGVGSLSTCGVPEAFGVVTTQTQASGLEGRGQGRE